LAEASKGSKKKYITTILRILVAAGALYLVLRGQNWSELYKALKQLNLLVLTCSVLLFYLANLVIAYRWYRLLIAQGIDLNLLPTVKIHFLGMFYNNVMLSSVGGDLLRAWYITHHTHKRLEAAFSVLFDRLIGLGSLILMALGFYWLFPLKDTTQKIKFKMGFNLIELLSENKSFILVVVAILIVLVVGVFLYPLTRKKIYKAYRAIADRMHKVLDAIKLYCRKPVTMFFSVILTFIAQSLSIIGCWFIGETMGIPVPFKYYFVFFPVGWVVSALPISIGGIGVTEGALVMMFRLIPDVTLEQALILAICWRIIYLLGGLPGIVIHLCGAHLPADKGEIFVDSEQSMD